MKINVVVGTYNEEFMLSHWLPHHVPLFDYGIVLDCKSTDKTLELVEKFAPHWDVVTAKNWEWFDAEINDKEIMECEEKLDGWKMCLNTTEYIVTHNFRSKVQEIEDAGYDAVRFTGYQINDSLNENQFDNNKPLILQRFFGKEDPWRHRIIHKWDHGRYYVGRHFKTPGLKKSPYVKEHPEEIDIFPGLYLFWYRFAPFNEQVPRKVQASPRIPQHDKAKGYSWNHIDLTPEVLEKRWRDEIPNCQDLLSNKHIAAEIEKWEKYYKKTFKPFL